MIRPKAGLLFACLAMGACTTSSDPRAVDAARTLVPEGSEIVSLEENTEGLTFESGPYFVKLEVADGGRGVGLADAIESKAQGEGWAVDDAMTSEDTAQVSLTRGAYRATVYVWLDETPVRASIFVQAADSE